MRAKTRAKVQTKRSPAAKPPKAAAKKTKGKASSSSRARPKGTQAKSPARSSQATKPAHAAARRAIHASPAKTAARPRGAAEFAVDKLHQIALLASNVDAAVAFYRDVLGLRFIAHFEAQGLAFFGLGGGVRLMLSGTASSATLYFAVADLDAAFNTLKDRGVRFLGPPAMIHHDEAGNFGKKGNEEWMAFFRDPSGNILALVEKR
jgi:catechol 2,3-dioxygenase-like lactoylglutathione lyase family enzyme